MIYAFTNSESLPSEQGFRLVFVRKRILSVNSESLPSEQGFRHRYLGSVHNGLYNSESLPSEQGFRRFSELYDLLLRCSESLPSEQGFRRARPCGHTGHLLPQRAFHQNKDLDQRKDSINREYSSQRAFHQNKDLDITSSMARYLLALDSESLPSEQGFRLTYIPLYCFASFSESLPSEQGFRLTYIPLYCFASFSESLPSEQGFRHYREISTTSEVRTQRAFHQNKDLDVALASQ